MDSPKSYNFQPEQSRFTKTIDMKLSTAFLLFLFLGAAVALPAQSTKTNKKMMLRHVVMFKFKDTSTPAEVAAVEAAFGKLPQQIKEIKAYEWGTNNSPENLNQGFTHCFLVSFASEADRAVYLPHPAHLAFVEVLKPHLDKVMVIDYWAK